MTTWDDIITTIPSRHMPPGTPLAGARRELAELAAEAEGLRYLEVGCRLGHSLAVVLAAARWVRAVVVDLWIPNYGDEPNRGPDRVRYDLDRLGLDSGQVEFITADSHEVLPNLAGPYDLIYIDGDHTFEGAKQDIVDCVALSEPGTEIVFDDATPELTRAWESALDSWPAIAAEVVWSRVDEPGAPPYIRGTVC